MRLATSTPTRSLGKKVARGRSKHLACAIHPSDCAAVPPTRGERAGVGPPPPGTPAPPTDHCSATVCTATSSDRLLHPRASSYRFSMQASPRLEATAAVPIFTPWPVARSTSSTKPMTRASRAGARTAASASSTRSGASGPRTAYRAPSKRQASAARAGSTGRPATSRSGRAADAIVPRRNAHATLGGVFG
jgi:hypothetical protein